MYGGGPVCDLGVHVLDGIHMMAGAGFPATVTARGVRSKIDGFDTADRAAILIEYPDGLLVSFTIDGAASASHELSHHVAHSTTGRRSNGSKFITARKRSRVVIESNVVSFRSVFDWGLCS